MTTSYSPQARAFILRISERMVASVAFDELSIFTDLAEEYFDDPNPLIPDETPDDDPLGAGLNEFLMPATPAAMAMVSTAFTFLQQAAVRSGDDHTTTPPPSIIRTVLGDRTQREELHTSVYQEARRFFMPADNAARLTETLMDALEELTTADGEQQRVINAWIEHHAPDAPLRVGEAYGLLFNVALPRPDAITTLDGVDVIIEAAAPDQHDVTITVQVESDDFIIHANSPQFLLVPYKGPSSTARFAIEPKHNGPGELRIFFSLGSEVFQIMQLTLHTGIEARRSAASRVDARGLDVDSGMQLQAHQDQINLIVDQRDNSYRLIVVSGLGVWRSHVNISQEQLAEMVAIARHALQQIVHTRADNKLVYQLEDTTIPERVAKESLRKLADVGKDLYDTLFYGRGSHGSDSIGDELRALLRDKPCTINIISEHFIFPWALLYDDDTTDEPTLDGFWGFRHRIAYKPEFSQSALMRFTAVIAPQQALQFGFVYNTQLDQGQPRQRQMVRRQRQLFQGMSELSVSEHPDRRSFLSLLGNVHDSPHIMYCYCHAVSRIPGDTELSGEQQRVADSGLVLSDGIVTLFEMRRSAPIRLPPLKHAPLVFINACESAKLSPVFYEGLVPYMIARGARGVLGTETETPVFFAAEFAEEFFKRLLDGTATIGEVMLDLRRHYLIEKRNLLGLLYTLYCSNDIRVTAARE